MRNTLKIGKKCVQSVSNLTKLNGKKWEYETELREVVLMAVSGKYAMVRRPGCSPYVCLLAELVAKESAV